MNEPVRFKDLSIWLKIAIVMSWAVGLFYAVLMALGFIAGILSTVGK
jgi:hypothetical protein